MELLVSLVIAYLVGLAFGIAVGYIAFKTKRVGSFTINHSDPTTDFCTLALDDDIDVIEKNKYISFKVQVK